MKLRHFMALGIAICLATTAEAGLWENFFGKNQGALSAPTIDVLIVHDKPGAIIEVKGKYKLYDPKTKEHISTRFIGKRKYMQPLAGGLRWGEEFPGVHQILIVPDSKETTTIVDGIEYKGAIYVYDVKGSLGVVNEVDIEDFVQSTLSHVDPTLADETLAALAIATRTNAYFQSVNPKSLYWAIDSEDVGYKGFAVVDPDSSVNKAIASTRYLVLSRPGTIAAKPNPFATDWEKIFKVANGESSRISLTDAESMAKNGDKADAILTKAYPNANIVLMYSKTPIAAKPTK